VWTWESEAFGNSLPNENPSNLGNFAYNLRFPGQYYDQETGLNYNYFRDYDPGNGRYTESDPIGLAAGINTFSYVGGDPVNWIDPTGENALKNIQKILNKSGIDFEGPKPNRKGDGGMICQIKYKKNPIFRVEVHPLGPDRVPVPHWHVAPNMEKHRDLPEPIRNIVRDYFKE
jgi:RHS repeat-associated protein